MMSAGMHSRITHCADHKPPPSPPAPRRVALQPSASPFTNHYRCATLILPKPVHAWQLTLPTNTSCANIRYPSIGGQYAQPGSASFAVSNPTTFEIEVKITIGDLVGRRHYIVERVPPDTCRYEVAANLALSGKVNMRWSWKKVAQ